MSPIAEALKKEHPDKKEYLRNELKSLGIEPDHLQNELNCNKEEREKLQAFAENIKSAYYQAYKRAYSSSSDSSQGNNNKDG